MGCQVTAAREIERVRVREDLGIAVGGTDGKKAGLAWLDRAPATLVPLHRPTRAIGRFGYVGSARAHGLL